MDILHNFFNEKNLVLHFFVHFFDVKVHKISILDIFKMSKIDLLQLFLCKFFSNEIPTIVDKNILIDKIYVGVLRRGFFLHFFFVFFCIF